MNGLLAITCGVGLQDGLNPCIFMTSAVFITYGLWLKQNSLPSGRALFSFVLIYALGVLDFNFGSGQYLILRKEFIFSAGIIYLVLSLWAFISGVLYFKDWVSLVRGGKKPDKHPKPFAANSYVVLVIAGISAFILSAMSTLGPINRYIMLLSNEAFLKGHWESVGPLLLVYVFFTMWPLWLLWAFLSIKNLRPSLLKIVCASVFFIASSCVVFFINW